MCIYKESKIEPNELIENREDISAKDILKLEVTLTIENSNLHDTFVLIDTFKNINISISMAQEVRASVDLEFKDVVPALILKNTNITSVKRKILNHIVDFYPLNILSKDIKINSFKLAYKI